MQQARDALLLEIGKALGALIHALSDGRDPQHLTTALRRFDAALASQPRTNQVGGNG